MSEDVNEHEDVFLAKQAVPEKQQLSKDIGNFRITRKSTIKSPVALNANFHNLVLTTTVFCS